MKALTSGVMTTPGCASPCSTTCAPIHPFERGPNSFLYDNWLAHRMFLIVPAQAVVTKWLESFKEFPIRQKPASFNLDEVMKKLTPTE